jgi:hypothetical protein
MLSWKLGPHVALEGFSQLIPFPFPFAWLLAPILLPLTSTIHALGHTRTPTHLQAHTPVPGLRPHNEDHMLFMFIVRELISLTPHL